MGQSLKLNWRDLVLILSCLLLLLMCGVVGYLAYISRHAFEGITRHVEGISHNIDSHSQQTSEQIIRLEQGLAGVADQVATQNNEISWLLSIECGTRHNCSHLSARIPMIIAQAGQIGPGMAMFLGDSITEGAWLRDACKRPILNAGIGGATVGNLAILGPQIVAAARPSVVVITVGTNDALTPQLRHIELFQSKYESLLTEMNRQKTPFILSTVMPVEASLPDAVAVNAMIHQENEVIRKLSQKFGVALIDAFKIFANKEGSSPKGTTIDGIHPSEKTYEKLIPLLVANAEKVCLK